MNKKISLISTLLLYVAYLTSAQTLPAPSPAASVMQTVGMTDVTIEYSAPGVKGRTVWGELVPFDAAWRAGANQPTKITFSTDVKIGDNELKAGSYNIFLTPTASGNWMWHFNGKGKSVFAYDSQEALKADDLFRVNATLTDAPMKERLAYVVEASTDNTKGSVSLWWEKKMISFEFMAPTTEMAEASIKSEINSINRAWRKYQNIAQYYAGAGNMEKAMEMIDMSIATKGDYFWNKWIKAGYLVKAEKFDEALDLTVKALEEGTANPDGAFNFFKAQIEKDLASWKANASKSWKKSHKELF